MMKGFKFCVFTLLVFFLQSCAHPIYKNVQNGDLIFVRSDEQQLSSAISRVTRNEKTESYDHIGIVEKVDNIFFVLHASTQGGSQKEPIKSFVKNQGKDKIAIFRLKDAYQKSLTNALTKANAMLGKPYNFTYVLRDDTYYCSDFIQRAFDKDSIFSLNPMTFINPKTGKIDAYWEKFYQDLDMQVPEGKLGCNPNGLSTSEKIYRVY